MGNKQEAPAAKPAWVAMYRDMDSSAFYMDARGNLLGTVVPAFGGGWIATIRGSSSGAYPDKATAKTCVENGCVKP